MEYYFMMSGIAFVIHLLLFLVFLGPMRKYIKEKKEAGIIDDSELGWCRAFLIILLSCFIPFVRWVTIVIFLTVDILTLTPGGRSCLIGLYKKKKDDE